MKDDLAMLDLVHGLQRVSNQLIDANHELIRRVLKLQNDLERAEMRLVLAERNIVRLAYGESTFKVSA